MPTIKITVPGPPMGKPTMTRKDKWAQRDCVVRFRNFANLVRLCAKQQVGCLPKVESVLEFTCVSYFIPPESWSKKRRAEAIGRRCRVKPDSSNILKGIEDILFEQDSALADVVSRKRYDWTPRVEITIEYEAEASVAQAASIAA